jgi:hypothetical protein
VTEETHERNEAGQSPCCGQLGLIDSTLVPFAGFPKRGNRRHGKGQNVSRSSGASGLEQLSSTWRGCRSNPGTGSLADPFAVNPIRRSLALVLTCALAIVVPWMIDGDLLTSVMLSIGWLAVTGLVMGIPILIWSLAEAGVIVVRARLQPPVEQLEISPRVRHVLQRHGFETIESVESVPDAMLLLLSNMDARGVHEIRRAIAVWRYRRWQEQGFPARGA